MGDLEVPKGLREACSKGDIELAFAILWVFCSSNRIELHNRASIPFKAIEGASLPARLSSDNDPDLVTADDLLSFWWYLDRELLLSERSFDQVEVGGTSMVVVPHNGVVADIVRSEAPTWDGTHENGLFTIVKHHRVLPTRSTDGITICAGDLRDVDANGPWRSAQGEELHSTFERLANSRNSNSLEIVLWPLTTWPYQDGAGRGNPIRLLETIAATEGLLAVELIAAVAHADQLGATIIVFPELMVPPAALAQLQAHLETTPASSLALIVIGRSHEADPIDPSRDRNQALVLGSAGGVLWEHSKIEPFNDWANAEHLRSGTELKLVFTPIGSLMIAICKDILGPLSKTIADLPVEILLVPSMSASTKEHLLHAKEFYKSQGTATFVANRPFDWASPFATVETAASFARLPGRSSPRGNSSSPARGEVVQGKNEQFLKVFVG
jgi:hypothetical protein